ncbi:MAG: TIM-barrel domain-containing protein [Cellulosilyticaceae bacterium]
MQQLSKHFVPDFQGKAAEGAVVQGDKYRFTILTSKLIRIEYAKSGKFEDRPTQVVVNRDFPVPAYKVIETDEQLEISTEHISVYYDKKEFTASGLRVDVRSDMRICDNRWYYGAKIDNLKGTYRTLDAIDGGVELGDGVLAVNGFTVLDDSHTLLIEENGWVAPREDDVIDLYFFGYGREYLECMKDYFKLTGETPMLPRYALGNWWSRYWKYDERELKELMTRFKAEDIPFSVSVIDMDWHLVDVDPKYGGGWTGYTWNKDLFPDPKRMLDWLHQENLKVTLNLHPAEGIRGYEEMYAPMAKALGVDYEREEPIPFNITDPSFMEAYFKYLHHPREEEGVDFWWIDWQQGERTAVKGLDPLWMLNHYHFYDMKKQNVRPLVFSRYAGPGSHRYPIGFSGDTYITWASYKFQPYFTSTASNIGYCWWSHDIGGHFQGERDDELTARWVQYGVFSPIMRLHSSSSRFTSKEPWRYEMQYEKTIKEHLRLRHQLVPYIYTMNQKLHAEGVPFIQPMYYQYPKQDGAYRVKNQYFFGSEVMVAPITDPINQKTRLGKVETWLPEGRWIDFFTGRVYEGNRMINMFRGIENQVVLAKEGAIIPMARHNGDNSIENPHELDILVFPGKDNDFTMYEDNGNDMNYQEGHFATTKMQVEWNEKQQITIQAAEGDISVIPTERDVRIMLRGVRKPSDVRVIVGGEEVACEVVYDKAINTCTMMIGKVAATASIQVTIGDVDVMDANDDYLETIYNILNKAQIPYNLKDDTYHCILNSKDKMSLIAEIGCRALDRDIYEAIIEAIM